MYKHSISLSFDNLETLPTEIKIKQNDTMSHTLAISDADINDADRAVIKFLRPDGVTVCDEFAYNNSEDYVICPAALAESGTVKAEISFYAEDARITTRTFTFEVIPEINTDYALTENDALPLLHSILKNIKNCVKKEDGKGLSTNDYDNTAKAAVDGMDKRFSDLNTDLDSKVGFTDYPIEYNDTENFTIGHTAGVVKVDNENKEVHGIEVTGDGFLRLFPAIEHDIANRSNVTAPITPTNLDYAVRSVKPKILTSLSDTPTMNTIYSLGQNTNLVITLPSGVVGDFIQVDFYSGETPTTLTVTSPIGLSDIDLIPEANTMYSLFFDYGIIKYTYRIGNEYGWRFSYAEYPNTEV